MTSTAAAGTATYVARCVGICKDADRAELEALLKGMCVRYTKFDENEYGMEMPLQSGTKRGSYRMIKQVQTTGTPVPLGPHPPVTWRLVHESDPMRGQPYSSLPAAVVEVSESTLSGIYSVQFMYGMGCVTTHRISRKNSVFVCMHEGQEVQVSVYQCFSRDDPRTPLFPGAAVEVRMTAGPEQQVEAAKKLGSFSQKLLPMVVLKKI